MLFDTWAWVEYFKGSAAGRRVEQELAEGDHATSIVSLAELSDHYHARGATTARERLDFVLEKTLLLELTPEIALAAGATKWRQRGRRVPMGLADALIYETARANDLAVLTGDPGFKGLDGVDFVD